MKRRENISSFGQVLHQVFERLEGERKKKESPLFEYWPDWVGKEAARHTKPIRVRKGCLLVHVDHPTWLYELNQKMKGALLDRIRRDVADSKIKRILFRLGEL